MYSRLEKQIYWFDFVLWAKLYKNASYEPSANSPNQTQYSFSPEQIVAERAERRLPEEFDGEPVAAHDVHLVIFDGTSAP